MSQLKLISERFSNISQYDQNTVQNLPTSVSTDAFESEYQLILPPLSGDKCITSYKYDSPNILQRLTTRRIEKHKNRLENWCEKLSEINEDAENQVIICCKTTADLLDASWERQKRLLNRNLANDQLLESEISDLESIWNQIDKEYAERRNAISNLENQLLTHERKRVDKIKEEFHLLTDYLSKYSHLPPNELQLFLQKEIFCIDIDLLENRRELANLTRNLHLAELINHRFTNLAWSNYRNHWQKINIDEAVRSFKVCINDVTFRHPTEVKTEIDNLSKKYTEYENDKEHLINEFCENVVPTNAIEEFLEKWNCKAKQLFTDWDETNQRCLNSIYKAYENNSQRWIDQIQQMKDRLLQRKLVNSSEEIENLIKVDCIPLLGELQSQFESNLNYLDQCFVWCVYIWPNGLIQPLLRYGQMVNKLWKQFAQEPINTVEKDLNNNLYSIQQIIFEEIKKKDEIINSSIDALRQCSNEQAINERLEETLNLFNDMKALYQTLNERQARIIDAYTKQVMNITDLCEIAVCRFFGVARCTKQQSLSLEKRIKQKSPVSGYLTLGYEQFICITQSESPEYTGDEIQNKLLTTDKINNTDHIFYHIKHRDIAVEDLVKNLQSDFKLDNQMNEFFIYLSKNLQYSGIIGNEINSNQLNNNSPVKLQSDKSFIEKQFNDPIQQVIVNGNEPILVNKYIIDYVKPIKSEKCLKIIKDVKTRVRVKILEYLEQWKNTVTLSAKEESIVKRSENDNEYLMQIKLHESRIRRVKEDVANVRQAELVLHQTRIERHTTAVNIILNEMKINATKVLIETLNKSEERMNEEIQNAIDKVIAKATKSSTLLSLRKQVENYAAIHNERVRQALKTFRQELSNQVQTVNNSNLKLIESLKLFTDGGNFTLSEAKRYSFNLNELSKNVKLFEEETLGSIESIERERQLTIENRLKQFESY
ncbi:unnamed protein product [Heterobilharzia americana]|nr:unnamed protein product [Heterobilharzia americana]